MSKNAHWSKVTKSLARKYGLTWDKAKTAYQSLKATSPRKPSLRMVSALPPKLPAKLKGARKKTAKSAAKPETTKPPKFELPPNVALAPAYQKPEPAPVPPKQGTRNKFEKLLKSYGLPVAALARNQTGKQIVAGWRDSENQEKLVKLLKQGHNQIAKNGWMREQTKERLVDLMEKTFGIEISQIMWTNMFKSLYGVKK